MARKAAVAVSGANGGAATSSSSPGAVVDAAAWWLNVSTSVVIVFVNKLLMDPKKGYGFSFGEGIFWFLVVCV